MPRSRDLVALSAILVAPLVAALALTQQEPRDLADMIAPAPTDDCPELDAPASDPPAPLPAVAEPAPEEVPFEWIVARPDEPAEPPAPLPTSTTRDPGQLMLMHDGELILHSAPEYAWSFGKVAVDARPGHLTVSRRVKLDRLPEPQRALAGATIIAHEADGSTCVGTVGDMRLQLEEEGEVYSGMVADDDDLDDFDPTEPPTDRRALNAAARDSLSSPGEDVFLVADQRNAAGRACTGVWARRADLPAPAVYGRRELSERDSRALVVAVLAVVREQPEFRDLERRYAAYVRDDGGPEQQDWNTLVADTTVARRWDEIGGPRRIVSVEVGPAAEACSGEFGERIALLLEQTGDTFVRLDQPSWIGIEALMDIERDGTLEAVSSGDWYFHRESHAAADSVADAFTISYTGCPC